MKFAPPSRIRKLRLFALLMAVLTAVFAIGIATPANAADTSGLKTAENALGTIVTNAEGMTLYMFDRDVKDSGESNCNGNCATIWPPATTTSDTPAVEGVTGTVGTITRADGSKQITLNGYPLYTFNQDAAAGETKGQGVNNIWWAISPEGNPIKPDPVEPPKPTVDPVTPVEPGTPVGPATGDNGTSVNPAVDSAKEELAVTGASGNIALFLGTGLLLLLLGGLLVVRNQQRHRQNPAE